MTWSNHKVDLLAVFGEDGRWAQLTTQVLAMITNEVNVDPPPRKQAMFECLHQPDVSMLAESGDGRGHR